MTFSCTFIIFTIFTFCYLLMSHPRPLTPFLIPVKPFNFHGFYFSSSFDNAMGFIRDAYKIMVEKLLTGAWTSYQWVGYTCGENVREIFFKLGRKILWGSLPSFEGIAIANKSIQVTILIGWTLNS